MLALWPALPARRHLFQTKSVSDPHPGDSSEGSDSEDWEEDDEEEEQEDDEEAEPDRGIFCTGCGTKWPTGPGHNFCSVCAAPRPCLPTGADMGPGGSAYPRSPKSATALSEKGSAGGRDGSSLGSGTGQHPKESKLVKQRELTHFKLPLLAGDAAEQRGWVSSYLAYMRRFDEKPDSLWHWANRSFATKAKEEDLHDREGRPHLDALLAAEAMDRRHFVGRVELADLFLELQAYSEKCHNSQQPPSGRWMIRLIHRRHFFDAARGTMSTEQHIYQLQLGVHFLPGTVFLPSRQLCTTITAS